MYEDDTPIAERRAQALALDRDLLRELLGSEDLRDLLDGEAVTEVEAELHGTARSADELHDLLLRRGERDPAECERSAADELERAQHLRSKISRVVAKPVTLEGIRAAVRTALG